MPKTKKEPIKLQRLKAFNSLSDEQLKTIQGDPSTLLPIIEQAIKKNLERQQQAIN